ncbi:HET-domain-containing protein, partial [Karstenula rhodostoma CBS 690.94]
MASPNQLSSSVQEDGEANFEHDEAISQLEGEPTRRHSAVRIRHPPKTLPNFIYEPLSFPTSIRILELLPGNKQDYIQCRLYETTFDQKPQYEALSYIWGDSADKSQIVCCDGVIDIPSNLRDLLRRIRHPSETRHLWADAICINQSDKKEVGHQVGQMSSIYTVAERVIIWLGFE